MKNYIRAWAGLVLCLCLLSFGVILNGMANLEKYQDSVGWISTLSLLCFAATPLASGYAAYHLAIGRPMAGLGNNFEMGFGVIVAQNHDDAILQGGKGERLLVHIEGLSDLHLPNGTRISLRPPGMFESNKPVIVLQAAMVT